MTEPIRVFIADDHTIVRSGLRLLLSTEPDIEVVGEAANGQEAVKAIQKVRPDVVLMDLEMPEMDGIKAIQHITASGLKTCFLVLTSFDTDERVFPAIQSGAQGYLLKDTGPDALVQAIRQVHRGESSLHPKIAHKLIQEMSRPATQPPMNEPLTAREADVLQLVAQGLSNQAIGDRLVISEATVRSHVSNILSKLHLASRTQAALYALREGYTTLDDV